jgi:hypothetical protein
MRNVIIISDGTVHGTKVYDAVTFRPMQGITKVEIGVIDAGRSSPITATITFLGPDFQIEAAAVVESEPDDS